MRLIEIPDAKLKIYMPEHLGECSAQQYIDMSNLIYQYQAGLISETDLKTHAVYKLLNLKVSKKYQFQEDEENKLSNINMLADLVESFFEVNQKEQKVIGLYYVHNPVPKNKILLTNYYGPSDSFNNITFGEYTDALRLFNQYHATGETYLLYIIASILYRPKKSFHYFRKALSSYDGDIRQSYNSHQIEERASKFKYADFGFIYGVYLYFASFQQYITTAQIQWGGKELDLSILFESPEGEETTETIPGIGMDSILFTMAESGLFGTLEKVNQTNLWQILIRMYDIRKRDLEQQQKDKQDANSNQA